MKSFFFIAVLWINCLPLLAKTSYFSTSLEKPVKVCAKGTQTFLIQEKTVSVLDKGALKVMLQTEVAIADAAIKGDALWLATTAGVYVYDIPTRKLKNKYFDQKRISAVAPDIYNRMWVATYLDGVYMQNEKDSFESRLHINGVYALLCTADSNVWVGTNVGMYRIAVQDGTITRYAEEGYSGYELPDNIVEHLYKDDYSNIWVIMPQHISFKSSAHYSGEIPSFAYVGDVQNQIETIVALQQTSYLFVTQKGVYLLPSAALKEEHEHHSSEVYAGHQAQAFSLNLKQIGAPEALAGQPVVFSAKAGNEIYFFTAQAGWKIKEKDLIKRMLKG